MATFGSGVSGIRDAVSSHSQSIADATIAHLASVKEMSEQQVNSFEDSKVIRARIDDGCKIIFLRALLDCHFDYLFIFRLSWRVFLPN